MKLSDYINFRNRGKANKNTLYNRRTQHFYDGKPMWGYDPEDKKLVYATGIKANFMNDLNIPTASEIALEQKKHFLSIQKTFQQSKLLLQLTKMNSQQAFLEADLAVQNLVKKGIKALESGIDEVVKSASKLKQIQSTSTSAATDMVSASSQLQMAYKKFLSIYNSIKNNQLKNVTDVYLQELDTLIQTIDNQVDSTPLILLDKSLFQNKQGQQVNFISKLGYLSMQIKGITLLEHEGIKFIKEKVQIPQNISFVGTGQILVNGKQASQDALFFEKNLVIELSNGEKVNLHEYLNNAQSNSSSISFTDNEWEQIMKSAIGLQSKYHRGGYIAMGKVSFYDVINTDYAQAKALRNLYILSQGIEGYQKENVTHQFNVKSTHPDYKALFSYCLGKFLDNKIIKGNYYMMTSKGIMDSYTYYTNLFTRNKYFAPIGSISVTTPKDYRIAINEN